MRNLNRTRPTKYLQRLTKYLQCYLNLQVRTPPAQRHNNNLYHNSVTKLVGVFPLVSFKVHWHQRKIVVTLSQSKIPILSIKRKAPFQKFQNHPYHVNANLLVQSHRLFPYINHKMLRMFLLQQRYTCATQLFHICLMQYFNCRKLKSNILSYLHTHSHPK